jgi:hypothetical protein
MFKSIYVLNFTIKDVYIFKKNLFYIDCDILRLVKNAILAFEKKIPQRMQF